MEEAPGTGSARAAVVALGEPVRIAGFALGGARLLVAERIDAVRRHWDALADDVALVVLTPMAAVALEGRLGTHPDVLTVVMP